MLRRHSVLGAQCFRGTVFWGHVLRGHIVLGVQYSGHSVPGAQCSGIIVFRGKNLHIKLWVTLGCSLRYTQMVPKWHLPGELDGTDVFNTRVLCDAQNVSVLAVA